LIMASALRFDSIRLDRTERTPSGALRALACVARSGVFEYRNDAGALVREYSLRASPHREHRDRRIVNTQIATS